jgi:hypothetical protein
MRIAVPEIVPVPRPEYRSWFGRWLMRGEPIEEKAEHLTTHPWYKVLWLTGVDYFSTLGYQPGIALLAAGAIAPIATSILVAVTLLGALPVYSQVAGRSYAGQGSIAMLENLLAGWKGKLLVLILLGFAATDFVITMTLSAADAAKHAIENPILHPLLGDHQILVTLALLTALAVVFLKGFKEAIGVAAVAAVPYLLLTLAVLVRGIFEILEHPEYLPRWHNMLDSRGDFGTLMAGALLVFPKLALGLSGFETGVSVMPLIQGDQSDVKPGERKHEVPKGRIANTKKLLMTAALIMSVMLVLSSFVTTLLIEEKDYAEGGKAAGRAIAFLAHKYMGSVFGSVYDFSTILILSLAGASAMAGLLHLIPRYLPRFGMAPQWVELSRALVLVLFGINVIVTLVFKADVEAQSGAYATGVLVLILSAAFAATLDLWRERKFPLSVYCGAITLVFLYTLVDNIIERPDGIIIGSVFIVLVMTLSGISRSARSMEFRVSKMYFTDVESARIARDEIRGKKVHLAPLRSNTGAARERKRVEIRKYYLVNGPIAFIHVELADNRSEFATPLEVEVKREGSDYIINVYGAAALANTIAFASEMIDPVSIFIGLTRVNLMDQAFRYLLWGEGETGLMVYTILLKYWEWTPEEDVRPLIFLMSD